jgi:hypothetical protein
MDKSASSSGAGSCDRGGTEREARRASWGNAPRPRVAIKMNGAGMVASNSPLAIPSPIVAMMSGTCPFMKRAMIRRSRVDETSASRRTS